MLTFDFEMSGPLFDGRAGKALDEYVLAAEQHLAEQGEAMVERHFKARVRNPTGYYQSHIRNRAVADGHLITDSRVIYGPWLEGTSQRNRETRFKGYASFRRTTQQLDRSAAVLAESIIDPYLARMGGRRT
jgi:hypothetical protein